MAQKAKKKAKKAKLVVTPAHLRDAGAIVAEVMGHFGAGYATERASEGKPATSIDPIFGVHADFLAFHRELLGCTSRNIARRTLSVREWRKDKSAVRSQVTLTAFAHGVLARKAVTAEATLTVTESQVMKTLEAVKVTCPAGFGGASVCNDTI
jgi:hypothetical protein